MPDDAHKSDILVAGGGNGKASGPQVSVAVDSGCADRDTPSSNNGSVLLLGTQVVATGVGPGVDPGVELGVDSPTALW